MELLIESFDNCLKISKIVSFAEILQNQEQISNVLYDSKAAAILFYVEKLYLLSDKNENDDVSTFIESLSVLTVIATENINDVPLKISMAFDIRLSKDQIMINEEMIAFFESEKNIKRYKILCGRNNTELLKRFLVSRNHTEFSTSLCKIIDGQNIFEYECNDYMIKLFREKSKFQSDIIMQCIISARNGDSRDILTKESVGFYKLVNAKAKEYSYGE